MSYSVNNKKIESGKMFSEDIYRYCILTYLELVDMYTIKDKYFETFLDERIQRWDEVFRLMLKYPEATSMTLDRMDTYKIKRVLLDAYCYAIVHRSSASFDLFSSSFAELCYQASLRVGYLNIKHVMNYAMFVHFLHNDPRLPSVVLPLFNKDAQDQCYTYDLFFNNSCIRPGIPATINFLRNNIAPLHPQLTFTRDLGGILEFMGGPRQRVNVTNLCRLLDDPDTRGRVLNSLNNPEFVPAECTQEEKDLLMNNNARNFILEFAYLVE